MLSQFIATCPEETKAVLADELAALGAKNVVQEFKAVRFEGSILDSYRINLCSRTASRILRVLREGAATNEVMLRSQASRVHWDDVFTNDQATYLIEGVAGDRGEGAMTSNEISKTVRMGLEDYFSRKGKVKPRVDLKEPTITIVAFVYKQRVTISIDYSGKTLHKRGYRLEGHPAPVKETLAASILKMAGYDGTQVLYDPMCGSGTIAVEAAFISLNKAPLIHRVKGDFGFEHVKEFDRQGWRVMQDEIRQARVLEPQAPIFAADISEKYVAFTRSNALRARVEKHIHTMVGSFFDLPAPAPSGLIVSNLPYGERIGETGDSMIEFFQKVGDTLKQKYSGWTAALLVAEDSPYKFIGLRPKRRIPILNGSIRCRLLIFELYAGSKKDVLH